MYFQSEKVCTVGEKGGKSGGEANIDFWKKIQKHDFGVVKIAKCVRVDPGTWGVDPVAETNEHSKLVKRPRG